MSILKNFMTWSYRDAIYAAVGIFVAFKVLDLLLRLFVKRNEADDIPWGLTYMKYMPRWVSGILHSRSALQIMMKASKQHPEAPFKIVRHDTDIIVLPESTVNELAGLSNDAASNILALGYDLVGAYSGLGMLNDMDLHNRVVPRRITPGLRELAPQLEDEVSNAISSYFPKEDQGWVEMVPYPIMNRLAARVFSRIVVGPEYCSDERWLKFAMNFTENVFNSIVFMRYFPPWMYPILGYLLPSVGECVNNIRQAEQLLGPVFQELLQEKNLDAKNQHSASGNGLGWLCELANGDERNPMILVHSQILLALGAIHTSLFAELNLIYDLMANPKDIETLRAEIAEVSQPGWTYESYSALHKLDSVLRESQRLAPPYLIGLRRIMLQKHTFQNGTTVPQGSYVCVLTPAVQNAHLSQDEDPEAFYGMRSYDKKIQESALKSTKYQYSTTDTSVLGFGYGRTACPGRFAASLTLKIIFVKLLTEYEFAFLDSATGRPRSLYANEIISPDPKVKIRVRKRKDSTPLF